MNRDRMLLHEMGHMWNGNMVTIEYYNDLWIKEGLTEFVAQFAWEYIIEQSEPGTYPLENRIWANFKVRAATA